MPTDTAATDAPVSSDRSASALLEMLRAKAMLLLRREKEVFELRLERTRTEAWLQAFHKISVDLRGKTTAALLDHWVAVMIDDLKFQVAAVYRGDPADRMLTLIGSGAPAPLPATLGIDGATWDHLTQHRGGSERDLPLPVRQVLGPRVGVGKFLWSSFGTRETPFLLLVAGFAPQAGRFYVVSDHDVKHYKLFGAHLAALLDNVSLIGALNSERSELQQSNQQLDASLHELRETQGRLVQSSKVLAEVSRRAGMAEVATGVLHNVGNVLNSVNVSAELAAARLAELKLHNVARIADAAGAERPTWPGSSTCRGRQGRTLPAFLKRAGREPGRRAAGDRRGARGRCSSTSSTSSRSSASSRPTPRPPASPSVPASQLIDDAFGIAGDLSRAAGHRGRPRLPAGAGGRARQAQGAADPGQPDQQRQARPGRRTDAADRRIVARIGRAAGTGWRAHRGQRQRRRASPAENLTRIFTHGFTTAKHGHGFGLHSSALAAREMGGTLTARSDGPGRGATFTLELPRAGEDGRRGPSRRRIDGGR